jgi:hypothetical protein
MSLQELKELYEEFKSIDPQYAFIHQSLYRSKAYKMCIVFENEMNKVLPKEQSKYNPIGHQMFTAVNYLTYNTKEFDFSKSQAIFDIYLHQIHKFIETHEIKTIQIHTGYQKDPIHIFEMEWDTVENRWMATKDCIDWQIEKDRNVMMDHFKDKDTENSMYNVWKKQIEILEARKKRLSI